MESRVLPNILETSLSSKCSAWLVNRDSKVKYMNDVAKILKEYSWIYSVRNVDIFLYDVLENISQEWVAALFSVVIDDLVKVPFGNIMDDWPDSLKSFIKECLRLGNKRFPSNNWIDLVCLPKLENMKKTPYKKQYEIDVLSDLIYKVCQETGCYQVLDVGSGLGYLDQTLHHLYGVRSVCLDSCSNYTKAAIERIKQDPCSKSMHHKTFKVDGSETCLKQLKDILLEEKSWDCKCKFKNNFQETDNRMTSSVLVGLHSCGNLTQDMMELFSNCEEILAFVCVGCCYNKVNLKNFPMSCIGKLAVSNANISNSSWKPCTSGLRLAAHGTKSTMVQVLTNEAEKNMFYRAIFECFIRKENIEWVQPKRHLRATDIVDFETYCIKMLSKHPLNGDEPTLKKLSNLYQEKLPLFPRIKILLLFQTLLQPLWEGFITVDRMLYFEEQNILTQVISLWDDQKSPRNLALCAFKRR